MKLQIIFVLFLAPQIFSFFLTLEEQKQFKNIKQLKYLDEKYVDIKAKNDIYYQELSQQIEKYDQEMENNQNNNEYDGKVYQNLKDISLGLKEIQRKNNLLTSQIQEYGHLQNNLINQSQQEIILNKEKLNNLRNPQQLIKTSIEYCLNQIRAVLGPNQHMENRIMTSKANIKTSTFIRINPLRFKQN